MSFSVLSGVPQTNIFIRELGLVYELENIVILTSGIVFGLWVYHKRKNLSSDPAWQQMPPYQQKAVSQTLTIMMIFIFGLAGCSVLFIILGLF